MKIPPISPTSFVSQPPVSKPIEVQSKEENQLKKTESVKQPTVKKIPDLSDESRRWAEKIRLHHPEKYAEWVARNREKSESGYPDVSMLPHGFSLKDFYAAQNISEE